MVDLLGGKIRLVRASAVDLTLFSSRWPASNKPSPHDYDFLDPWLPLSLKLATGQYVSDSGDSYPISRLRWRRLANGSATASWSKERPAGEVTVSAIVQSLKDLLQLAPVDLDVAVAVAVAGKPDASIALQARVQR